MNRKLALLAIPVIALVSCTGNSANQADKHLANDQLNKFRTAQPTPVFEWSQLRQNLIEIETTQAKATVTHSFFMGHGAAQTDPLFECPSIGLPIPSTYQLTNPQTTAGDHGSTSIAQIEATGVYTNQSSGTHVICLDANGKAFDVYWEGDVMAFTHDVTWDYSAHKAVITGNPTAAFTAQGH